MSKKKDDKGLYVTKDDFQRLQNQVATLLRSATKSTDNDLRLSPPAAPPPRPPDRKSSSKGQNTTTAATPPGVEVTSAAAPPGNSKQNHAASTCKRPGCDHRAHHYSEVVMSDTGPSLDTDDHTYERLANEEDNIKDIPSRLRKVELNQQSIMRAQDSIKKDVTEVKITLEAVQKTLDKVLSQVRETSDHLGQQILHVRKDIQAATQKGPLTFRPEDSAFKERLEQPRSTDKFEWEVCNVDNLIRSGSQVSSQSFQINQIDFKIIGAASCSKDGRMHLRIFGDFTHFPSDPSERKSGRFTCTVNIVDRSGHVPDWVVGKVVGDFHNDKQFMVGDVSVNEIKQKGFVSRGGDVQLRFDIETYA